MTLRSQYSAIPLEKIQITPFDKVTRKDLAILSNIASAAESSDLALHKLGACVLLPEEDGHRL